MSYGLQLSAAGVLTSMYRMDVHANNLANTDTVGFKPDIPAAQVREPVTKEDAVGFLPSNSLLERLGGGTLAFPTATSYTQSSLRSTGNELDLAIQGEGFFVIRDVADAGGDALRFTRDGRFTRNADGLLVMATTGMPVLDVSGNSIKLPKGGGITVDTDGTIRQGQVSIARVQVTDVPDRAQLRKQGHSLFTAPAEAMSQRSAGTGSIRQNHIEESGVDEVRTLLNVTNAARDIESNLSMIQQHDRLMERAITVLGRVN